MDCSLIEIHETDQPPDLMLVKVFVHRTRSRCVLVVTDDRY